MYRYCSVSYGKVSQSEMPLVPLRQNDTNTQGQRLVPAVAMCTNRIEPVEFLSCCSAWNICCLSECDRAFLVRFMSELLIGNQNRNLPGCHQPDSLPFTGHKIRSSSWFRNCQVDLQVCLYRKGADLLQQNKGQVQPSRCIVPKPSDTRG